MAIDEATIRAYVAEVRQQRIEDARAAEDLRQRKLRELAQYELMKKELEK